MNEPISTQNAGALIPPRGPVPAPRQYPPEPPIFTALAFNIKHAGGASDYYTYAAIRAGDGKWYITGGETKQGVDWVTFCDGVRDRLASPLWIMIKHSGVQL